LVTDTDYSAKLEQYDPAAGDGPWTLAPDGRHFWNGKHCLEVMYEGDLPLSRVAEVDFVRHRGLSRDVAGIRFIASVVARNLRCNIPGFVDSTMSPPRPTSTLFGAASLILLACNRITASWGAIAESDPVSVPLARAFLNSVALTGFRGDESIKLAGLFRSPDDLQSSVASIIANSFGLPSTASLLEWS